MSRSALDHVTLELSGLTQILEGEGEMAYPGACQGDGTQEVVLACPGVHTAWDDQLTLNREGTYGQSFVSQWQARQKYTHRGASYPYHVLQACHDPDPEGAASKPEVNPVTTK